jgi:hypothetical protein
MQEQSTTANRELTSGERAMGINFNPGGRADVDFWKYKCAELYDWLNEQPIQNEGGRLKAIAQTHLEHFQMSAVQAITYFDDFGTSIDDILPTPTEGQLACTVSFNLGGRADVNFIKSESADAYDRVESFLRKAQRYVQELHNKDQEKIRERMEQQKPEGEESKANDFAGFLQPSPSPEQLLLERKLSHAVGIASDGLYDLRQFQKFAVKAITR